MLLDYSTFIIFSSLTVIITNTGRSTFSIEKDVVMRVGQRKKILIPHEEKLILFTKMVLLTLLMPAVCRMCVI